MMLTERAEVAQAAQTQGSSMAMELQATLEQARAAANKRTHISRSSMMEEFQLVEVSVGAGTSRC